MCDCMNEIMQRMKESQGYKWIAPPMEMFSGKTYITFTVIEAGGKKRKEVPLLLEKCPFCGEKYRKNN